MNITIGNVVRGVDFFDREELLRELWEILETDSVLLAAPRRVGKTSIMHRLIDYPEGDFRVLFLDGQNHNTSEDLVTDLIVKVGKLTDDPRGIIREVLGRIREDLEEIEIWKLRVRLRNSPFSLPSASAAACRDIRSANRE